jgi:CheY-like chemotaxis protein
MFILFIDDDTDDYEFFCEALNETHTKVRVLHAVDGYEGLELLQELTVLPEYIFLDVNMPRMDGKQVFLTLKSSVRFKDIPVIIYSTTSNPREREFFNSNGVHYFLIKPPSFNELVSSLKSLFSDFPKGETTCVS